MANPCLQPQQSDFRGYPWEEFIKTKTESFQRNNCPSGQDGSWVSYSKTYTSYVSESDLDRQIINDTNNFNSEGQANANAGGTCSASCVVQNSQLTGYAFLSLSASQIWLMDSSGRIRQPINKSTVLSGAAFSEGPLLRNGGSRAWTYWMSPYPYISNTIAYMLGSMSGNNYGITLTTMSLSGGNACSPIPAPSLIFSAKTPGGWAIHDALCLSNGILFLVGYNYSGGVKSLDVVWHQFGGNTTIVNSIQRPHNYKYYAYNAKIAYNGSTAFIMATFASKNNDRRRRTGIFQVNFTGSNPSSVTQTVPFDYSNTWTSPICGCRAGSKLFFLYGERTSGGGGRTTKVYPILGGSVSAPSFGVGNIPIWDYYNQQVCYIGNEAAPGSLAVYHSTTNVWESLR